jgi:hypothetical protein
MHFPKKFYESILEIVKKGGPISDDDWEEILSNLKKALHPFLSQIANKPLGDLNLLDCSSGNILKNEIKPDNSNNDCVIITIRTPGLWFPAILLPKQGENKTDRVFVWGITRNDDWVLLTIDGRLRYEAPLSKNPTTIYDFEVEFMRTAYSCPLEIQKDCGITFEQMYQQILKAVSDWAQRRRKLADEAVDFDISLRGVNSILNTVLKP